jgi:hypothetical protein
MPYLGITFCLMCFFCTLGIQVKVHIYHFILFSTFMCLKPENSRVQFFLYQLFWLTVDICVQMFGGVINDGNPRLPGSAIAENEYPIYAPCVFALMYQQA